MPQDVQKMLDSLYLRLLYNGGLDNWEWYDESISEVEDMDNDDEVIQALQAGGVDNWEWYGESLGEYSEYSDYVTDNPSDHMDYDEWVEKQNDMDKQAEKAVEVIPVPKPELSAQNKLLLEHLMKTRSEEEAYEVFEKIVPYFWKYTTSPKEFKKALSSVPRKESDNFIFQIAKRYLDLTIQSGSLDKIVEEAFSDNISESA